MDKLLSVLFVDDEEQVLKMVESMFAKETGYRIQKVLSAAEAISLLEREQFDIVLADQVMPGMTGTQLLQRVSDLHPGIIRILTTGQSDIQTIVSAVNEGKIFSFLRKPFKIEEILLHFKRAADHIRVMKLNESLTRDLKEKNLELNTLNKGLESKVQAATVRLRDSEEKYRRIFEESLDAIFISDAERRPLDINQVGVDLFGFFSKEEMLAIQSISELIGDPGQFQILFTKVAKERFIKEEELTFKKKNGEKFNALINVMTLFDEKSVLIGFHGIIRDITGRKKMEAALRESEERYRLLAEMSWDAIFIISSDDRMDYVNPQAARRIGMPKEKIIGRPRSEVFPPEAAEYQRQHLRHVFATGEKTVDTFSIHIDDQVIWEEVHLIPVKNDRGEVIKVLGVSHDITKFVVTENELKLQNVVMKTQLETTIDGILVVDDKGHYLYFNQNFIKMWEIPAEIIKTRASEIVSKSILDKLVDPQGFLDKINYLYDHKDEISRDEIVLKNGTHIDRYSSPMHGADGKYFGRVWYFRDITERVQRESMLQKANDELTDMNLELKNTQARLIQQEKLASIGRLAAGVAHELNNPIGFISSNFTTLKKYFLVVQEYIQLWKSLESHAAAGAPTELCLEKIKSAQEIRVNKKLDFILDDIGGLFSESEDGLERITKIVQNLRSFSRIDVENKLELFDLNQGIHNTLAVAHNEIKYIADVSLHLADIPRIECVSGEINQVLLNIVVNAAQAIREQNHKEKGWITISTRSDATHVFCEIANSGPSIPAGIMDKIFDPFFTTKGPGKGTGLGLNISYDIIINKHKGDLSVRNLEEKGVAFSIKLPIHSPTKEIAAATEKS